MFSSRPSIDSSSYVEVTKYLLVIVLILLIDALTSICRDRLSGTTEESVRGSELLQLAYNVSNSRSCFLAVGTTAES